MASLGALAARANVVAPPLGKVLSEEADVSCRRGRETQRSPPSMYMPTFLDQILSFPYLCVWCVFFAFDLFMSSSFGLDYFLLSSSTRVFLWAFCLAVAGGLYRVGAGGEECVPLEGAALVLACCLRAPSDRAAAVVAAAAVAAAAEALGHGVTWCGRVWLFGS